MRSFIHSPIQAQSKRLTHLTCTINYSVEAITTVNMRPNILLRFKLQKIKNLHSDWFDARLNFTFERIIFLWRQAEIPQTKENDKLHCPSFALQSLSDHLTFFPQSIRYFLTTAIFFANFSLFCTFCFVTPVGWRNESAFLQSNTFSFSLIELFA